MKRLIGEMIFASFLFGGIQLYGKHKYKKGWNEAMTFSNNISDLKQKFEELLKKDKES